MSRKAPAEDEVLTPEELSEILADATNTGAEEIERGAAELEIGPPEEADVVEYGEHDGADGFLPDPDDEWGRRSRGFDPVDRAAADGGEQS
jgi:hypothetical protein